MVGLARYDSRFGVEELDLVALLERDHGFLPIGESGVAATHPPLFAAVVQRAHVDHGHLEELLDRVSDLDLVGRRSDLEDDLIHDAKLVGLLGEDDGAANDVLGSEHGDSLYLLLNAGTAL